MPFDPITWTIIIGSFLGGAAVGYFWDEISAWFTRVIGYILDQINRAIEVTSDAIVYLVKQGKRYYKRVEVFARNIYSKVTRLLSEQEEISQYDIPEDLNNQLEQKLKLELGRRGT
ncbi:MAG: hypothetical protein EAZ09_19595 [Oscillatoriales cyanobacterium]|nr:MAG: hypothetical protein EAZ18_26070 [Oscillatoriales cyanobacterium]TAH17688.1 MAG: hypothetical protein EAZ09_19595 [Oscillatoriales cyanobacterium]